MRRLCLMLAAALLVAAARAHAHPWQRQLEFAHGLCLRGWFDLAEIVGDRLAARADAAGAAKPALLRALGDYETDVAELALHQARDFRAFIAHLHLARTWLATYLGLPEIHESPEGFELRQRMARYALAMAEGHACLHEDSRTPAADRAGHRAQATQLYEDALAELERLVGEARAEVERSRRLKPPAGAAEQAQRAWLERYRAAREQLFRVRLERDISLVRFARLLRKVKAPAGRAQARLEAAERDLLQLLLDYPNTPGAIQANLELARCLIERGPEHDAEVLERLAEVWDQRRDFTRYKRIPCDAAHLRATVLLRQKRAPDALAALDALLVFASDGAWTPERRTAEAVADTLHAVPEADRENYDQGACADAFLLAAEALAALAEQAERAGDGDKARALYRAASCTAIGVLRVRGLIEPKYAPLVKRWRGKAGLPPSDLPELLEQEYQGLLKEGRYLEAARVAARLASLPPDDTPVEVRRRRWRQVGRCYHAAGRDREAAMASLAAGRWFPEPRSEALEALREAARYARLAFEQSEDAADERFLLWIEEQAEPLDPEADGVVYVKQALAARRDGDLQRALERLGKVRPDQPAWPDALYQLGLTHLALLRRLPAEQRAQPQGTKHLREMEAAFHKLLDRCRAARLQVGPEAAAKHGVELVSAALAAWSHALLAPPLADAGQVLELTADLEATYAGIAGTHSFPYVLFQRVRAACTLSRGAEPARATQLVETADEAWSRLRRFGGFEHLDSAAGRLAAAHLDFAARLDALVERGADREQLRARARWHQGRADELQLELVKLAPDQPLRPWVHLLRRLWKRDHEPKSADYRTIAALAPGVIERFKDDPAAAEGLLHIQAALGVALHALGKAQEAVPLLEEVDGRLDERHGGALRSRDHAEVKARLAEAWLAADRHDRYERGRDASIALYRFYRDAPEAWGVLHTLCESYRRLGQLEAPLRELDRAFWRSRDEMGGPASKRRFRSLAQRLLDDVRRLDDPARRARLEPFAEALLRELRR